MRASTRSPTPMLASMSTSGPRALCGAIRTSGRSPSSSHTAGLAMRSPSSSRPVTSRIVTEGRPPFLRRLLRSPDSMPSSVMLASRRLKSTRCGPRTPKARAISRLPTLVGDVLMNSMISSRPGSPSRLGGPPFWLPFGLRGMSGCLAEGHGALRSRRRPSPASWSPDPWRACRLRPCPTLHFSPPAWPRPPLYAQASSFSTGPWRRARR